jgi:hypothetical protein
MKKNLPRPQIKAQFIGGCDLCIGKLKGVERIWLISFACYRCRMKEPHEVFMTEIVGYEGLAVGLN